ncbi:hypothetical protein F4861DRAFT_532377 [Xylaria intraflava]|nr:hypothetical protein F4861DRAFT_532377 [Xylaria intraflava]
MLRRSHKKTKKGSKCEECRRRHIRASLPYISDQRHPVCINCQNSDRICTYRGQPPSATSSHRERRSPNSNTLSHSATPLQPSPSPESYGATSPESLPCNSISQRRLDQPYDSLVDVLQLEVFHHFIQGSFLFINRDIAFTDELKKTVLSSAFSTPYLLHGILAVAARHISTQVAPENSHYYLDLSTKLQTWAVTNFDPAPPEPNGDTCVAVFFFSSLICVHGLIDIASLDLDPEPFLIRFGHYFGLQRGVRAIIDNNWAQLNSSKIQSLFQWWGPITLSKGRGPECNAIWQLVMQSTGLSPAATEACRLAIEQLQCVLDECSPHQPMPAHSVYLTLAWPLLIPEKMTDLLVLRRPAALIILAYYGVTLYFCRDLWMVGQAGKCIVHAVKGYLGPSWAQWLQWPCEVVGIEIP